MSVLKKSTIPRQSSYSSLYVNPLTDLKHNRSSSEGEGDRNTLGLHLSRNPLTSSSENNSSNNNTNTNNNNNNNTSNNNNNNNNTSNTSNNTNNSNTSNNNNHNNKENAEPNIKVKTSSAGGGDKENVVPPDGVAAFENKPKKKFADFKSASTNSALKLKPTSLQLCMQFHDPNSKFSSKLWDPIDSDFSNSADIWDYSDSEAAPASSWSALPNRSLLYRPLPLDIGRCTCVIVKEKSPEGLNGGVLYSLYTYEGQGRQDRKLAVAHHRRRNGRSEFTVAQNTRGILSSSDDSLIGTITANVIGSKYRIWDQGSRLNSLNKKSKSLLAAVAFMPTIATWTGSYRSMRTWIPKHQSMLLKSTTQAQHINGLPKDWEGERDKVQQLFSRVPHYNDISKQYELDFRDRGRAGLRIQSSVKNFQLTVEKNGRQTILQLGRVGKSNYVMDYRYPLTGYQAFCMCLASIDSKLCCTV